MSVGAGPAQASGRALAERVGLTLLLLAFFVGGYFGVGLTRDPSRARELGTALDEIIPFLPATVWIYLWVFPAALLPVFVVRSRRLFRRTVLAYAVVIAVSLTVFVLLPVTSTHLRADPAQLDASRFDHWSLLLVYDIDPPVNLFPSLHLSIATLAAMALWKARRSWGAIALAGVGLVLVSICTVKQHFLLDGLAGLALGLGAYAILIRPLSTPRDGSAAFSWRGPTAYLAFQGLVFLGLLIAFVWG